MLFAYQLYAGYVEPKWTEACSEGVKSREELFFGQQCKYS